MNAARNICAVVPVKDIAQAKQRLAGVLSQEQRRDLALAMLDHVLAVLSSVSELSGVLVVTIDPAAAVLAAKYGAVVSAMGAREGHSGAVAAAVCELTSRRRDLLTLPGDLPLVEATDIRQLLATHHDDVRRSGRAFCIVPARDRRGSNAVLCSPADAVPLCFGYDSFLPHLAAARGRGIEPRVMELPRIALDIDTPEDLAHWLAIPSCPHDASLIATWRQDQFCCRSNA
jgi:2-phospho-L-lactate guanylyltransferase